VARVSRASGVSKRRRRRIKRGKPDIYTLRRQETSQLPLPIRYLRGVDVEFIRPGKPVDNTHIDSFNGSLRDECLNSKWFENLHDARKALQAWRRDDNELRPHS
jgi:transposase InsO family protein